jgi:DNA polymerase elongation subunit (family B)
MAIKHNDYATAREMLDGKLAPYLNDETQAAALAYALKIVINIVYGLTSAKFDNPFRDNRNIDNIVAKRGALFMIELKHAVQDLGFTVAHIKTDSIKIPDATPELIKDIQEFGQKFGYEFEHEATYDAFCLVNDAVYIARKSECQLDCWVAVGAQFQHPYVFKTLFSGESVEFDDFCETKSVTKGVMYLDFDAVGKQMPMYEGMHHIGRTGRFVPVTEACGGGILLRVKDDKSYAVSGTKGHLWVEATMAQAMAMEDDLEIDMTYFEKLADTARRAIEKFGSFEDFVETDNG